KSANALAWSLLSLGSLSSALASAYRVTSHALTPPHSTTGCAGASARRRRYSPCGSCTKSRSSRTGSFTSAIIRPKILHQCRCRVGLFDLDNVTTVWNDLDPAVWD